MTTLTRRRFLHAAGLVGAASALGACDTAPGSGSGDGAAGRAVEWWDHNLNLQDANQRNFDAFEAETGIPVTYTYNPPPKLGQALQLARQSKQLPDIHSLAGLQVPIPTLIDEGWLQPITLADDVLARLPENALVDGIHIFDGKLYTVPIFNERQYWAVTWFNRDMLAAAEVEPPGTYDEFRAVARAVQESSGDDTYGWIFTLAQTSRVAEIVNYLAQAAGFEGFDGELFRTGEIAYHHDAYLTVVEFLLSLQQDGLLVPGSQTLDAKEARVRWAAGASALFFDGPWCPGSVMADAEPFLDTLDVAPMLVPEAGMPRVAYRGPQGGVYWLSAQASDPDSASRLLGTLTEDQYYVDIATGMAQPPFDLSAVEKADVREPWSRLVGWFAEQVYHAPVPVAGNVEVAKVIAATKPVEPDLGQIVSGAFSGDVTDVPRALKELSDKSMAAREDGLGAARKAGADVDVDDWAFPDWRPRQDFTAEMYG